MESNRLISIADGHVKLLYYGGFWGCVLLYVFTSPFLNPIPSYLLGGFRISIIDVHCTCSSYV